MLEVRKAEKDQLELIAGFQLSMALETENLELDRNTVLKGVAHIFDHPETGYYLIAVIDKRVVASLLVLFEWSDWRNGNVIWIHSVYVQPEYRGQGIFSEMYEALKGEVIADPMLRGIRLYVDKTNKKAQKVYAKLGMNNQHYDLFEWMPQ